MSARRLTAGPAAGPARAARRGRRAAGAGALVALAAACVPAGAHDAGGADGPDRAPTTSAAAAPAAAAPHEVVVRASDFAFRAPDTIPSGLTRVRLVNDGPELHHLQLVRLAPGRTVRELIDSTVARRHPAWAAYVGGPNVAPPGGGSEVTVELAPGEYVLLCYIDSPADHAPHFTKGMLRRLVVGPPAAPGGAPRAAPPRADARMVLDDYSFAVTPAIRAGRRTVRVENAAHQPHEVAIVRLAPGKSVADLMAWLKRRDGAPPGEPVGGALVLSSGAVNFVTADFAAGDYALLCFAPDAKDGKPHVAHGMVSQIRVE